MRLLSLCALAAAAVASPVWAGFTATTTTDNVLTPAGSMAGPQAGDTFATTTSGGFSSFIGDTPADPTLAGSDLNFYRYTLNGSVASVNTTLGTVDYTGTYRIFYDANLDGLYDGADPTVSAGTFNILAAFIPTTNNATLAGTLMQTTGPSNPAFRDLSEGGSPVIYNGTYMGTDPGVSGTIQGVLRQNAVAGATGVPLPAGVSGGLVLLATLGLGHAIRRRTAVA